MKKHVITLWKKIEYTFSHLKSTREWIGCQPIREILVKGGNAMQNYTLAELEAELKAAKAINDFEDVAVICNAIADLKGEPRPYDQEWFDDL